MVDAYGICLDVETAGLLDEGSKVDGDADTLTLHIETQESIHILHQLVAEGAEVPCGTPLAYVIDEYDLDDVEDVSTLTLPTEVKNTYDEDLVRNPTPFWGKMAIIFLTFVMISQQIISQNKKK